MGEMEVDADSVDAAGLADRLELNPLRAAGWIFRDGDCIEIERQGEELPPRVVAD